jgi:hypothetical protein
MLDRLELSNVAQEAPLWEKVVRKVRAGMMPPAGRPRPPTAEQEAFASWLEKELDFAAAERPNPGKSQTLRRMNRTEYGNAIRDLLDLTIDATTLLPADDASYGFDNIAGVLKVSPVLMERYIAAAQRISRLAMGTGQAAPVDETFRVKTDLNQNDRFEDLPFGTRGGTSIRYVFPQDAEYVIEIELLKNRDEQIFISEPHQLDVTLDGGRVRQFTLTPEAKRARTTDPRLTLRMPVRAGPHVIGVTFVKKTSAAVEDLRQPFLKPHNASYGQFLVSLGAVTIKGPFSSTGPGDTPSRRRILQCRPEASSAEAACARQILTTLARRAFRRPPSERELSSVLAFYEDGRTEGGFEVGLEYGLQRLLTSPDFLFRIEREPPPNLPNSLSHVSDLSLASRLSFFLWSSIPDDELLNLAGRGELAQPAILETQVRRMLRDSRSQALISNFAGQWLHLRNLAAAQPDSDLFPDFDEALRQAFRRETELFVESIIREDRSILGLIEADYTFVNERLARHYGIANVYGSHFRRITLPSESMRGGLLGQGSLLTVTSHANRTSPVLRGKWILENLLGTPPPPPPPNIPALKEKDTSGKPLAMRERMVQHRGNPVCASCHAMMDPPGLSLENFDAVGKWRDRSEANTLIDTSGVLPDGTKFDGAAELRAVLLKRSDVIVRTVIEKLVTYALGRGLEYYDAPAVRSIANDAAAMDYSFSAVIVAITKSTPFLMRRSEP